MPNILITPTGAYPSIPDAGETLESHTFALQAIRDSIETGTRQDGNFLESFITFQELVDLGIIDNRGDYVGIQAIAGTESAPGMFFVGDLDTGIFSPGANIFAITAGGTEAVRYTGSSAHLVEYSMNVGIIASTTQTQGQQPLTASYNQISVTANKNDTVTLPGAVKGRQCLVINSGANDLRVFPASGDDLGKGVDQKDKVKKKSSMLFVAFDTTTWHDVATKLENLQDVDIDAATDNDLLFRASDEWVHTAGLLTWDATTLKIDGAIKIKERAAAIADTTGYGQLWIKDDQTLWFTEEDGTDHQIAFV